VSVCGLSATDPKIMCFVMTHRTTRRSECYRPSQLGCTAQCFDLLAKRDDFLLKLRPRRCTLPTSAVRNMWGFEHRRLLRSDPWPARCIVVSTRPCDRRCCVFHKHGSALTGAEPWQGTMLAGFSKHNRTAGVTGHTVDLKSRLLLTCVEFSLRGCRRIPTP
jgi:hypothetical protein